MSLSRRELLDKFFQFFVDKQHTHIDGASVVPTNDATVLFTTAGMQPLVPYLLGQRHPAGNRLVDVQRCIRTNDIDEVGDDTHCTFFEMLGNWSLGEYFKDESIEYSFELLTKVLGIPLDRLAVTVFEGNEYVDRDTVSASKWRSLGVPESRIAYLPAEDNWWPNMEQMGPCGADTEIFYWKADTKAPEKFDPEDNRWVEIWNNVFMEYNHDENGYQPLIQKNVDTGMGVERVLCVMNGKDSVYDTELFSGALDIISRLSNAEYADNKKAFRIIAEHIRSATMMIGDDIETLPSNIGRGYVLRRLIRRSINYANRLDIDAYKMVDIINHYIDYFAYDYPALAVRRDFIIKAYTDEVDRFNKTLVAGEKEFNKTINAILRKNEHLGISDNTISGKSAFRLFDTFGFPIELTIELARERGYDVDIDGYNEAHINHQNLSRTASAGSFKGGLADSGEQTIALHTAAHIMLAGLNSILDGDIIQKGSNITSERLRFDYNNDAKLSPEQVSMLEKFVNDVIDRDISVICEEMPLQQARDSGASGIFDSKYADMVKVYTIDGVSKEICGGPHIQSTGKMGRFRIIKQENVSSGVKRIKAVLE